MTVIRRIRIPGQEPKQTPPNRFTMANTEAQLIIKKEPICPQCGGKLQDGFFMWMCSQCDWNDL